MGDDWQNQARAREAAWEPPDDDDDDMDFGSRARYPDPEPQETEKTLQLAAWRDQVTLSAAWHAAGLRFHRVCLGEVFAFSLLTALIIIISRDWWHVCASAPKAMHV